MARWRVAPRRLVQSGGRVYSPGEEIEHEHGLEAQGAIELIPVLESVGIEKRDRLAALLGERSDLMGDLAMLDDAERDAILYAIADRVRAHHELAPAPEDASVGESEDEPAAKAPAKKKSPTKKAE